MNDHRLLIATSNPGKLAEIRLMLPGNLELLTLADLGIAIPDEPGYTFSENAVIKAIHAAHLSGLPTIADDSGLEVEALAGRPGVLSARYAGRPHSDERNYRRVLDQLQRVTHDRRRASFRCVVAFVGRDGTVTTAQGESCGSIVEARGNNGFGYDPIFELGDGRTMAELEPVEKNRVSHRSRAVAQIRPHVLSYFSRLMSLGYVVIDFPMVA